MLAQKYGITVEDYQRMWDEQNGLCAICQMVESRVQNGKTMWLSVDHDHDTGAVRGLLCQACNAAIGFLNEDTTRMMSAIKYVERYA